MAQAIPPLQVTQHASATWFTLPAELRHEILASLFESYLSDDWRIRNVNDKDLHRERIRQSLQSLCLVSRDFTAHDVQPALSMLSRKLDSMNQGLIADWIEGRNARVIAETSSMEDKVKIMDLKLLFMMKRKELEAARRIVETFRRD